jgi:hypothetical protein
MKEKLNGLENTSQPKGGESRTKALSDGQKRTVQQILAKYDPRNLSYEDASAIFRALEEVEIYSPGVFEEVHKAGIDPRKLFTMAMEGKKIPTPSQGGS